ncbi:MAG: DUF983 domain-containing protein [Alphaproteobacteria bacterium]|nr:DUF983 domain-containing protein [Alphaproteobacteria bacterium]
MTGEAYGPISPFRAGLACRCPRCGRGKLFDGFLAVAPACTECGLDLGKQDSGDGPAVFIVLILGFIIVAAALILEMALAPPLWLHLVLWIPVTLGGSLLLLRPFKGVLLALQFHHGAGQDRSTG